MGCSGRPRTLRLPAPGGPQPAPPGPSPDRSVTAPAGRPQQPPEARPLPRWRRPPPFLSGAVPEPLEPRRAPQAGEKQEHALLGPPRRAGPGAVRCGARGARASPAPGLPLRPPRTHLPRQPGQAAQSAARHLRGRRVGADLRSVAAGLQRAGRRRHDTGPSRRPPASSPPSLRDDEPPRVAVPAGPAPAA